MARTPRRGVLGLGPLAVLVVASVAVACGKAPSAPSVILISIDTLRADHLGCYGYPRDTSPAIDALSADGVLFRRAFAPASSTLPSHASMFSSLLPQHHGASMSRRVPLPDEVVTLAEVLQRFGYRTAAFGGGGQLDAVFGFGQGFEVYEGPFPDLAAAADDALRWVDGLSGRPFFLFLHSYEVHHPYEPRPEILARFAPNYAGDLPPQISVELLRRINRGEVVLDDEDLDYVLSAYDAEILAMDRSLGLLFDELRARDLYRDSLIVLTSDHGEEFGEHGSVGWHSHTLFEELLRVPLIMKLPGARAQATSVDSLARLIDLAPTIVDLLGLEAPAQFSGSNLFADRSRRSVPIVAMLDHPQRSFEALRLRQWKWFDGRLFDLEADPGELKDLAAAEPEIAAGLEAELRRLVGERGAAVGEEVAPDAETLERLRALGYLE